MGTWDYCWFWLLKVNAWGKMIDLHFSKTQDKQVKPKINTTYRVIIALRSCFMWYSKPFKKLSLSLWTNFATLGHRSQLSARGSDWFCSEGPLMRGTGQTPHHSSLLCEEDCNGKLVSMNFFWKKREWTEFILQVKYKGSFWSGLISWPFFRNVLKESSLVYSNIGTSIPFQDTDVHIWKNEKCVC